MNHPLIVGLTGGVASGKSAAATMLAELGAGIVDTDVIAREVVSIGSPGLAAVVDEFGPSILLANGELDRARLRALVFADPAARKRLEAILHPRIGIEARQQVRQTSAAYVLLVVPLLVESGNYGWVNRVLVVDASVELQSRLLTRRDGISADLAERMIAAQASREQRLRQADDVLRNSAGLAELATQARTLDRRYRALCAPG
ncbi:MAG: dephospho-CoA kinase [Lysobacterales bacterium]|nr:dephospho-CoA kinase [Xanthomonadales bacterium]MCB1611650.1 dephospho-CoA kinase [Xanthomonadales bacterium]